MEVVIRAMGALTSSAPVEVVERKGIGHPDTICDALAEQICVHLCRYYLQRFGSILHHNVDKLLLCGGSARPAFGGGEVVEPLEIYLAGRATNEYQGEQIPVDDIAVNACREWLKAHLPNLDVERHVRIVPKLRPGSGALTGLFSGGSVMPLCNDTSFGAGFAPYTPLERVVLEAETLLNSSETKAAYPAIGQDIKVMGVRHGSRVHLTVGCAMVDRYIDNLECYEGAKSVVRDLVLEAARHLTDCDVEATVNAADDRKRGRLYLTVTGTSSESGDDGEVGRGNRTSGLITPYRPMSLEAAAGKNPVSHIGKLYNLAAAVIASNMVCSVPGVMEANCIMLGEIGRPIDDPLIVDAEIGLEPGGEVHSIGPALIRAVELELKKLPELQKDLMDGRVTVY